MFYSHTFLSRKAPLGTVWCAAHLQHRLKKSHYAATDIPSTVDHIMFPEVPIALRMSGHLLLGIVRIYSKKVDYLFHDCNIILIGLSKLFAPSQVNLPEEARQAPVQAITLPVTFDLDAIELDNDVYDEGGADNHISSPEDITLTDQIPIERETYVAITFDDDIVMDDTLPQEAFHESGSLQMDDIHEPQEGGHVGSEHPSPDNQAQAPSVQDLGPSNEMGVEGEAEGFERHGPSNQTQVPESVSNESPQVPERENPRDDVYTENLPHPDDRNNPADLTGSLEKVLEEKEIRTPSFASGEPPIPFQQHSDPPASASIGHLEAFGDASAQQFLKPSPPPQQPRQRRKTRRMLFDEKLVLPNRSMKRALEDCSDLVRKRKKTPCSALGVWKLNNKRKMDQVFNEPSLTGLCEDICDMFKRDGISINPQLVVPQEVVPDSTVPQSTAPTTEAVSELRASSPDPRAGLSPAVSPPDARLRDYESYATGNVVYESNATDNISPYIREDSPLSACSLESEVAPMTGNAFMPSVAASTGTRGSEFPTPGTLEQPSLGNTGFSTIPEEHGTSETDLYFLEDDSNTQTESATSQGVGSLPSRTRAVAKYLQGHSPITPISEDANIDLSLNKILEGKTRKVCARMFFETLVLKSYGMVDVRQEEPYGDITLELNPSVLAKVDTGNKM